MSAPFPGAIHTFDIVASSASAVPDSEGRPVYTTTTTTGVVGRVCILGVAERQQEATLGEDVEASILVPLGTSVQRGDQVVVAGYDAHLDGTWDVVRVRHTPHHLRVLSRRVGL